MVLSRDLPLKIEEHVDQTVGIYAERSVTNRLCRDAETLEAREAMGLQQLELVGTLRLLKREKKTDRQSS